MGLHSMSAFLVILVFLLGQSLNLVSQAVSRKQKENVLQLNCVLTFA